MPIRRELRLNQPIHHKGINIRSIKLREPCGSDILKYGEPFQRTRDGVETWVEIDDAVARDYLLECSGLPGTLIGSMAIPDYCRALSAVTQFFIDAGCPPDPWAFYSELTDRFHWPPSEVAAMPLSECMQWYIQTAERDAKRAVQQKENQASRD